jgi:uncharacterized protein (UPF0276 family)
MLHHRPQVGLLFNPSTPEVMREAADLVDHLAVMPSRLWYDFGDRPYAGRRFHRARRMFREATALASGRGLTAHGFGLSLPSAMPLDQEMVGAVQQVSAEMGGFDWFSEHLNQFVAPLDGEPNTETGLALPVVYDEESYQLIAGKLKDLSTQLGCRVLLENGAVFTPIPDMEYGEPEFLNRLHVEGHGGTLLDLHNLLVSSRNGGDDPENYLERLDPESVEEVHVAGGEEVDGFYTDSHSRLTPPEVWELAHAYLPSCPNLRAITFEYHESYYEDFGLAGVIGELERMHELAGRCACLTAAHSPEHSHVA